MSEISRSALEFSRRRFLKASGTLTGGLVLGAFPNPADAFDEDKASDVALVELPKGAAPRPLSFPYFPDRLHTFVWRNWPLVPAVRMASVVGARTADIERIARAMGLGKAPKISREQEARSYITVIKRNWHLLPYDQLVQLLGWSAGKLAYTLREDDFLFVKLGNLKPECEPLRYKAPNAAMLQRERAIARVVREEFAGGVSNAREPLFGFVEKLSQKPKPAARRTASDNLKFCYSYFALYGDPLLETQADPYPNGLLGRLAAAGVNGVWLQAVLYKLAPFPWDTALSVQYETRLKNLRALVQRASRHCIKVFLYLNEPRAMPLTFYQQQSPFKGVVEGDHAALCTSVPGVQQYLVDSVDAICRAVPGLGGFFSITASENLTNCWSHGAGPNCPRCSKRSAPDVIAEVNQLFFTGIRRSGAAARLLAWDWGWDDNWADAAIQKLPEGVELMSVSEWRLPLERGGVKTEVGEYSISAVGPGPRARRHWQLARSRGLKTIAKVQAGNTWELSAVPWIPAVQNVARHAENLRGAGVSGFMLGWTLGGYPSPNLEVFSETLLCGSGEDAMQTVAERRFGKLLASAFLTAWQKFSAAFGEYPYHGGVMYSAPQQLGPANLFWEKPTGYHATMVGFPYDDLNAWRAVYAENSFIQQFDKVADGFDAALAELKLAVAQVQRSITDAQRQAVEEEGRVAEAAAIHFRSVANQARFVQARRTIAEAKTPGESAPSIKVLETVLRKEIALAYRLHQIQCADSRIGFEASNHYYYVPSDLVEKVLNCRHLLETWLPRLSH